MCCGPEAAGFLLVAAQTGALPEVDADAVLRGLRCLQVHDGGANHGEFYYPEEAWCIRDPHATFFTGLAHRETEGGHALDCCGCMWIEWMFTPNVWIDVIAGMLVLRT